MKKIVAFEPFNNCEMTYISTMQSMISSNFKVVSFQDVKKGYYNLNDIGVFYLNWIEGNTSEADKKFIEMAKHNGVKIVWVFHNKLPHDAKDKKHALDNIKFYISIADKICVLSHKSIGVLQQYCENLNLTKIHFLPHQNFNDMYGHLYNSAIRGQLRKDYVKFNCLGLIRPYKNIELLIEAFTKFKYKDKSQLLIAGKPSDQQYVDELLKIKCDANIILDPTYIPSSMMGAYIEASDVLVMPYNKESSMNSGAMIMAFSYGRTVIIPQIEMVSEFPEDCIYSYDYTDKEDHLNKLIAAFEKAYEDGVKTLHQKGNALKEYITHKNSKEIVKNSIVSLLNGLVENTLEDYSYALTDQIIQERELWKENCLLMESQSRLNMARYQIADLLKQSNITEIAIYGYGFQGKKLFNEMKKNGIKVSFIIDRNSSDFEADVPIYNPNDEIPPIGYIIVTSAFIDVHAFLERNKEKFCCVLLKEIY